MTGTPGVDVPSPPRMSWSQGTDALDPMLTTTYPVVTGARRDNGTTPMGHFNGAIDDLRVYPRALSASEVQGVYQKGQ